MIDILNKYLVQHKRLNVPGLGTIFIEKVPAITDFAGKQIFGPQYKFRFDKYFDTPDKDFFTYLASEKNIPDYEAIQLYNEFAQHIRSRIKSEDEVIWEDICVFKKTDSGDITFEQINKSWQLYGAVTAERVIYNNASHGILVGDTEKTNFEMTELLNEEVHKTNKKTRSWKLYAWILFAIAMIVLILHFYKNGFTWESVGNQQPIDLKDK